MNGRYLRVRDLLRAPGVQRHDTGAFPIEPAGISSARVRHETEITYALILEAQGSRVTAKGQVEADWEGPCRRCLEPTGGRITARVDEIFQGAAVPGETWPIDDGVVDLEPVLREALLLELPLVPLCRPDCPGPDPERYPTAPVPDDEGPAAPDPRWAALDGLKIDEPRPTEADR